MMNWLGGETSLICLVTIWWLGLLVWRVAATAGTRRVWWALAAFALSATLYVGPVARFAASVVGSSKPCDQFENLWGVGVSGLVVVVLCVWASRTLAAAVVVVTVLSTVGMAALAANTTPSPVGCVATLDLPWYSPYWWIITVVHAAAALAAAVVCLRDAVAIGRQDRVAALAVGGVALGFFSSAAFWLLMWVSLVSGDSTPAEWGSVNMFPVTVVCMAACTTVGAVDAVVAVLRHRTMINAGWREYRAEFALADPGEPVPTKWHVIGPWWSHPAQSVHQLRIQTSDLRLVPIALSYSASPPTSEVPDRAPTT